jgi:hypothetical protein
MKVSGDQLWSWRGSAILLLLGIVLVIIGFFIDGGMFDLLVLFIGGWLIGWNFRKTIEYIQYIFKSRK